MARPGSRDTVVKGHTVSALKAVAWLCVIVLNGIQRKSARSVVVGLLVGRPGGCDVTVMDRTVSALEATACL